MKRYLAQHLIEARWIMLIYRCLGVVCALELLGVTDWL